MQLPILYHKGKKGELRQWRVWTEGDTIFTEYGQVNGQLQVTPGKLAKPKNVGKKNETTAEAQADAQCQSMWTHKIERKYAESPEEAQEQLPLPMLAKTFYSTAGVITSLGKKTPYPVDLQRKFNGVRCLAQKDANGNVQLTSRSGKPYTVLHLSEQLAWMPEGMILDGEIYIHGMTLQKITSLVKKNRPESVQLEYHVYDMPSYDGNDTDVWTQRNYNLGEFLECSHNVFQAFAVAVSSESDIKTHLAAFLGAGYEGAIIRCPQGVYQWGYRSNDLMKVKLFQDEEFEVIGARNGEGKYATCVVWECRNDITDGAFECTMRGTLEDSAEFYRERDQYIGRKLTVRFFDRTDDQLPQHGTGVAFRMTEDLPV